jgi:hypothetical protein
MILATAIGEESFTDQNGSGYYVSPDPFANLGEPFLDVNESGAYVSGDPFYNFYNASAWQGPASPAVFKGIVCTGDTATSTCTSTPLGIGAQQQVIMSGTYAVITPTPTSLSGSGEVQFLVTDANGNPMAAGTQISASVSPSGIGTVSGNGVSFTTSCGCSNVSNPAGGPPWMNQGPSTYCPTNSGPSNPYSFYVNFAATGASGSQGAITINVTTPGTKITTSATIPIRL